MRKTLLSVLPLVVLLAPVLAQMHFFRFSPADLRPAGEQTVTAAGLSSEQVALNKMRSRIGEARRLLQAQAETATDRVALAVAAADSSEIQLLDLPKSLFLSKDADFNVTAPDGTPLRLRVVRPNYVNTAVRITDEHGRDWQPLLVRYPVEKNGALDEVAYYTSAHPAVRAPELVRAGSAYVRSMLDAAAAHLAAQGKPISPSVEDVAERLCVVEHTDHKRFITEEHAALFDEIYTLYALNSGDTYRYSVSTAGAGGMVQMIPPTYAMVRARHAGADLEADFVTGMRDHSNALEAMLLYMQDTWDNLADKEEVRQALASGTATQPELLAAGYNSNPARLPGYLKRGGAGWRALIPAETQMYLRILAAVDEHIALRDRA